jgi:Tfp pilus assembly protein PilO
MIKTQPKPLRLAPGKKAAATFQSGDGKITAFLSHADEVVERHASKALAGSALRKTFSSKTRAARALSNVERELSELKKVVEALAVRSVAHDREVQSVDVENITVLDAETAYELLENPPQPTETLRSILALR